MCDLIFREGTELEEEGGRHLLIFIDFLDKCEAGKWSPSLCQSKKGLTKQTMNTSHKNGEVGKSLYSKSLPQLAGACQENTPIHLLLILRQAAVVTPQASS